MLGVVHHALALCGEEADRVGDHREVLLGIDLRDLLQVQAPGLADQAADRNPGLGHQAQAGVAGRTYVPPPRHPEGDDLGVLEGLGLEQHEAALVLRVRAEEARFDEVRSERIERVRDPHLLLGGYRHSLALHPITQGRVVQEDGAHVPAGTGTGSSQWA